MNKPPGCHAEVENIDKVIRYLGATSRDDVTIAFFNYRSSWSVKSD